MSLEDEAMRWLYAVSQHSTGFALDMGLGLLLTAYVMVVWRLVTTVLRQRREGEPATPALCSTRRPDGALAGGSIRSGPMTSTRVVGAERRLAGRP
jgi:hypothetical protein